MVDPFFQIERGSNKAEELSTCYAPKTALRALLCSSTQLLLFFSRMHFSVSPEKNLLSGEAQVLKVIEDKCTENHPSSAAAKRKICEHTRRKAAQQALRVCHLQMWKLFNIKFFSWRCTKDTKQQRAASKTKSKDLQWKYDLLLFNHVLHCKRAEKVAWFKTVSLR